METKNPFLVLCDLDGLFTLVLRVIGNVFDQRVDQGVLNKEKRK